MYASTLERYRLALCTQLETLHLGISILYIHACIQAYVHAYIHTCMHECIHTYADDLYTRVLAQLTAGTRVKRGPDWEYGNQDKGGAVAFDHADAGVCVISMRMHVPAWAYMKVFVAVLLLATYLSIYMCIFICMRVYTSIFMFVCLCVCEESMASHKCGLYACTCLL